MKSKLRSAFVVSASLSMLIWAGPAISQDAAPTPPVKAAPHTDGAATITRVYDVQDLLLVVKDYPLTGSLVPPTNLHGSTSGGGGGGAGGGQQGLILQQQPAATPPPLPTDQIKHLILDTIDSTSWKDNGGDVGSIAALNSQLFIKQTVENQAAVSNLLDELRQGRAHMVRVRADWVLLAPGQIDKVLKNGAGDTAPLPEVNRATLQSLPQDTVHYTGTIACFSGQTVHLASGRARNVVTGVTPVVATEAIAMDPQMDYVHFGASLEVTPTVSTDSTTLDLSSVVSQATGPVPPPSTQPALPTVDRLNDLVQHFHTTVQVPLNKPVLIGGATADPNSDLPGGKELYLIIEADTGK